jgi:hypothetical protein
MNKKLKPEDVPKGISEICVRLPKVKFDTNYGFYWPEKSRLPIVNGKRTMFIPCKFSTNVNYSIKFLLLYLNVLTFSVNYMY